MDFFDKVTYIICDSALNIFSIIMMLFLIISMFSTLGDDRRETSTKKFWGLALLSFGMVVLISIVFKRLAAMLIIDSLMLLACTVILILLHSKNTR